MLYCHQVWAALSRFNWLCLVLLERVSQILVTRLVLSLIYHSPLVVFIQLEDLADLKVGKIDLGVLDNDRELLKLVELAQSLKIIQQDVDWTFQYQRCHKVLKQLSIDP